MSVVVRNRSSRPRTANVNPRPVAPRAPAAPPRAAARRARRRTRRPQIPRQPAYEVDPCTAKYALAVADPFEAAPGACLPSAFPLPSGRRRVFARFTSSVGTAGFGYILVAPGRFASNNGGAGYHGIYHSTPLYAGTTTEFNGAVTGVASVDSNSDYASTEAISYRLVSIGLRIRSTSPTLSVGGLVTSVVHPGHTTLNAMTSDQLRLFDVARTDRPQANDKYITLLSGGPVVPAETDFSPIDMSATSNWQYFCMAMAIDGTSGDKYYCEVVGHYEYVGTPVRDKMTDNATPGGLGVVSSAFQSFVNKGLDVVKNKSSFLGTVLRFAISAGTAIPKALNAINSINPLSPTVLSTGARLMAPLLM